MNSAKPPPPPQRPGTSRPPPPPPLRSTKPSAPSASVAPTPSGASNGSAAPVPVAARPSVAPAAAASHAAPPVVTVPGQETRIRVSVKLSVRDPNLLIARPLAHGEPPPPGTREATLVLVEPAAEPANASNGEQGP